MHSSAATGALVRAISALPGLFGPDIPRAHTNARPLLSSCALIRPAHSAALGQGVQCTSCPASTRQRT